MKVGVNWQSPALASTLTDEGLTWELLGAYQIADDYETWCVLVGLAPTSTAADRSFALVHRAYADLWSAMGDAFFTRLDAIAARWALMVLSSRGGRR